MGAKKIFQTELAIQLVALGGGFYVHHLFERLEIAIVMTLALECFLHFVAFMFHYAYAIEKISEWVRDAENPLSVIADIKAKTAPIPGAVETLNDIRAKSLPLEHLIPPPEDWPFDDQYRRVLKQFREDLRLLYEGSYSVPMDDIQDVSLRVVERIENGAFCTALEENLEIFKTPRGQELLNLQYRRAKALAQKVNQPFGFARLFIFEDLDAIAWDHRELMRENHENGVEVLLARKGGLAPVFSRHNRENRMDFGRWGQRLLMEIRGADKERTLHVSKRQEDLQEATRMIVELRKESQSYVDFEQQVRAPVNLKQWSRTPETVLELDPPDGPHPSDCDAMLGIVEPALKDGDRIAVYGLTKRLIERATATLGGPGRANVSLDVVDVRSYAPARPTARVDYRRGNWLEWRPDKPYAAIVADDVLCNLSSLQMPMLFQALAAALRPGGLFVVRTTALYSQASVPPSSRDILQELGAFDPTHPGFLPGLTLDLLSPGAVCEAVWPVLHTEEFYESKTRSFQLEKWNNRVRAEGSLSVDLRNRLVFQRLLRMTSMDYHELEGFWKGLFREPQEALEVFSKWKTEPGLKAYPRAQEIGRRFGDYYRIVVLQRI